MAAMMLTRLMRMLVRVTVANAMRKPIAKPLTRLIGVNLNARLKVSSSEKLLKMRAATTTTARPTPRPMRIPSREATSA
jgi:hypothetical protein